MAENQGAAVTHRQAASFYPHRLAGETRTCHIESDAAGGVADGKGSGASEIWR